MAARAGLLQARKEVHQTMVDQTGGPWTDVSFSVMELRGYGSGQVTRYSSSEFQVSSTGVYLVTAFVSSSRASGSTNDIIVMSRLLVNGSTTPAQSYGYHGEYGGINGRHGHSHHFLVSLTASDIVKLQYRANTNIANYLGTPASAIGGSSVTDDVMSETDAGSPAGAAVSTISFERIGEDIPLHPYLAVRKTANASVSLTFADVSWDAEDLRQVFASASGASITIPEDGCYIVGYNLEFDQVTSGSLYQAEGLLARCVLNGSDMPVSNARSALYTSVVGRPMVSHRFCKRFIRNDVIKLQHRVTTIDDPGGGQIGGNTTTYREAVTSMFLFKVSDYEVIDGHTLNDAVEAATAGQTGIPSGWSESHTDSTPVNWHVSSVRSAFGTKSIRYGNQTNNDYAGAGTNSGSMDTAQFSVPSGYTTYYLALKVFAATQTGAVKDLYSIEVHSAGLGLLTTIPKISLGNGSTSGAFLECFQTISASVAGRSDIFLRLKFDTVDSLLNTTEGVYFDDFRICGY